MKRISADHAMPPIGFATPPDSAAPVAALWLAAGLLGAVVAVVLAINVNGSIERITAPRHHLTDAQLFPKDADRCCDANGNEWMAR